MALFLIGTGISFDLTLYTIEQLKKCDEIYIETYTTLIEDRKIESLERAINKKIKKLERNDVESRFLIDRAKNAKGDVVLLVSGDPLTATTHISLIIDAKSADIETKIIHNSSIFTAAAGKAGLQLYKFGKTASIPNPREKYNPTSWFDVIRENIERNAHTLILLDTEPKPMDAKTALVFIEKTDNSKLLQNKKLIVLSRLGEKDEKITYNTIEKLKKADLGKPPFALIIPGKLHIVEEEYLQLF